ncbi:hypothetical protein JTB14_001146 [Gonioctena quinquepunctata]|nr:hypothetical protein JTB14_001146 [Gonioctena quinquepunctata]
MDYLAAGAEMCYEHENSKMLLPGAEEEQENGNSQQFIHDHCFKDTDNSQIKTAARSEVRLCSEVMEHLELNIADRYFRSDSRTVLQLLKSEKKL